MPGYIDSNTFAVNVLENDFNLKDKLTRNMTNCLIAKYDQQSTTVRYEFLIEDLEILE